MQLIGICILYHILISEKNMKIREGMGEFVEEFVGECGTVHMES